ncbi:hypothetical protein AM231_15230 [Paenibacillus solani]|uniref:Uncharacterized protein n=1 Tax=Paenibacillus solani TaxID=1705565 RepID=A0A0M1P8L6_9BACL|nr:hypothetical protein AM231_15230 [Paenibacillus solani]
MEELIKPATRLPKNQLLCIRDARSGRVGHDPTPSTTKWLDIYITVFRRVMQGIKEGVRYF